MKPDLCGIVHDSLKHTTAIAVGTILAVTGCTAENVYTCEQSRYEIVQNKQTVVRPYPNGLPTITYLDTDNDGTLDIERRAVVMSRPPMRAITNNTPTQEQQEIYECVRSQHTGEMQ